MVRTDKGRMMSSRTRICDDSRKRMFAIICLGEQSSRVGILHPEYADRVRRACDQYELLVRAGTADPECVVIVLTGGVTIAGSVSEAALARRFLDEYMAKEKGSNTPMPLVLQEERSVTTEENLRFSKQLFYDNKIVPKRLFVIARTSQVPKVEIFLKEVWRDVPTFVISGLDTKAWWYRIGDSLAVPLILKVPRLREWWTAT